MLNRIGFSKTDYGSFELKSNASLKDIKWPKVGATCNFISFWGALDFNVRSLNPSEKKDLRAKYKFKYNNQLPVTGWQLYSTEMLESGSFGKNPLNKIGSIWKSLEISEQDLWKEKAKIENEKRVEANEPAILEALENKDFLALSEHEFKKYNPEDMYIYKYELSVLRLNITKKILS